MPYLLVSKFYQNNNFLTPSFYSTLNTYESYKLLGNHHTILMELKLFFFNRFFYNLKGVLKHVIKSHDSILIFSLVVKRQISNLIDYNCENVYH